MGTRSAVARRGALFEAKPQELGDEGTILCPDVGTAQPQAFVITWRFKNSTLKSPEKENAPLKEAHILSAETAT